MKRLFRPILLFVLIAVVASPLATVVRAGQHDIEPFIGRYIGHSITNMGEQVSERDFDVSIKATKKDGFEVSWTTFIRQQDGSVKKKDSTIAFQKTERPGIYSAAQRQDIFGNAVPFDPMEGEPYVWARLVDNTLSIYGLLVTDNGDYEIQAYHRTLTETGMALEFVRSREKGMIRRITGNLSRVSE